MKRAAVFDETYAGYLAQLENLDLSALQEVLGYELDRDTAVIPLFGKPMRVSTAAITDDKGHRVDIAISVVLCKYLLMAPDSAPQSGPLMTFKDFADAAPLINHFGNNVERRIARLFSGHIEAFEKACQQIGGEPYEADLAYQVKYRFRGLPRVPVILLFNDAEEGFSAQCTLLFEQCTQRYLDMESLAILGGMMVYKLERAADLD